MIKNVVKKLLLGLSLAGVISFTAAVSACTIETAHPTARITVEFNDESYELNYTMYRNMYPNTVRHFIELADAGFYNDMLVHNYGSQDWTTGGYNYDADAFATAANSNSENFSQYFEDNSKESEYMELFEAGKLTPTVFYNLDLDSKGNEVVSSEYALPTLIGEFYNNINQEIEKGALDDDYGTLKMFYYPKSTMSKISVTPTPDQIISAEYKNNCATSLFMMQVSSSSGYGSENYTVFARISNLSDYGKLLEDVDKYLSDNYGETPTDNQTYGVSTSVDNEVEVHSDKNDDRGRPQNFRISKKPIIIRSVKITKY